MSKLTTFTINEKPAPVSFVETTQVKEGVSCDVYTFPNDGSRDLAIVTVEKGFKTPSQRILKGVVTIEGYVSGEGTLTVQSGDKVAVHEFNSDEAGPAIEVRIGQIMQWHASGDSDLVFYEICEPPYEDGRFENLQE